MGIFDWIKGNEVFAAAVVLMVGLTLYGHYRGFMRMLLSAASMLITLVLADMILPYTRSWVEETGMLDELNESIGAGIRGSLPEAAKDPLIQEIIGIDRLTESASETLGGVLLNIVCFVLLFILIRILIRIIVKASDVITSIPVISGLNQLGGAAIGFSESVIYIWIIMTLAALTPAFGLSSIILSQTAANGFLRFIYENNIIVQLILGIFGG